MTKSDNRLKFWLIQKISVNFEPIIKKIFILLHRFLFFSIMDKVQKILQFLHYNPQSSREDIAQDIGFEGSDATLKRLIANGHCPLSFRTVDSIDYKKAMLIFYEQNSLYAFKQIFIQQFKFAVKEYF